MCGSKNKKEIKGIIFDIDNTLLATNGFVIDNLKKVIEKLESAGFSIPFLTDEEIKRVQSRNLPFEEVFMELFVGEFNGKQAWEFVLENYRSHVKSLSYCSTPGAIELINYLHDQGFKIGLVTNRHRMIEERLQQAGFSLDKFLFISSPLNHEFCKPHPKSLDLAFEHFRSVGIEKDELVLFGDHHDDYFSAYHNNVEFVAVLQGLTSREEFIKSNIPEFQIVNDLTNGLEVIEKINKKLSK